MKKKGQDDIIIGKRDYDDYKLIFFCSSTSDPVIKLLKRTK